MNFLTDTNVAIYKLQGKLTQALPEGNHFLSVITEIELLAYPDMTTAEETNIKKLLANLTVLPLTEAVKSETIKIKRQYKLKLPDAIIVASAKVHNCTLLTNDESIIKKNLVPTRSYGLD